MDIKGKTMSMNYLHNSTKSHKQFRERERERERAKRDEEAGIRGGERDRDGLLLGSSPTTSASLSRQKVFDIKLYSKAWVGCLLLPSKHYPTSLLSPSAYWVLLFYLLPSHNLLRTMEGGEVTTSLTNEKKGRFKRICVFCGSRAGYKSTFSDAALELGKQLVIYICLINHI